MVLLLHSPDNGPSHFDWLLAREDVIGSDEDRSLLTFRVGECIAALGPGSTFHAEPLENHRARYLRFEGPLGAGRGSVRRVAEGVWSPTIVDPRSVGGSLDWGSGARSFVGGPERGAGGMWRFEIAPDARR
jgi:hypothetical protein